MDAEITDEMRAEALLTIREQFACNFDLYGYFPIGSTSCLQHANVHILNRNDLQYILIPFNSFRQIVAEFIRTEIDPHATFSVGLHTTQSVQYHVVFQIHQSVSEPYVGLK